MVAVTEGSPELHAEGRAGHAAMGVAARRNTSAPVPPNANFWDWAEG